MKLKLFGALIGALMLAVAAPAGAATVTGTSIVNPGGSVSAGDPALNFSATDLTNGVEGINGASFDNGKRYYDYIFSFTLNSAADVSLTSSATAGTNVLDGHAALFSSSPAGTDLLLASLVDLTDTTGLLTAGNSAGNPNLNSLDAINLAAGTYYLRLFGVIAGNSNINSHLTALAGTFTAVAATPIPAALPLFASALGLFGFMGWRRKAAITAATA